MRVGSSGWERRRGRGEPCDAAADSVIRPVWLLSDGRRDWRGSKELPIVQLVLALPPLAITAEGLGAKHAGVHIHKHTPIGRTRTYCTCAWEHAAEEDGCLKSSVQVSWSDLIHVCIVAAHVAPSQWPKVKPFFLSQFFQNAMNLDVEQCKC